MNRDYMKEYYDENKEHCKALMGKWYNNNYERHKAAMKKYIQSNRQAWREVLHGLGLDKCTRCPYDKCFNAIDYHHPTLDKSLVATVMFTKKPTEERVEQFKTAIYNGILIPLCANCHREEHFRLRTARKCAPPRKEVIET